LYYLYLEINPSNINQLQKLTKLISDTTKFKRISESLAKYTLKIETQINVFLRKLKNEKVITENTFTEISATGSTPGILYGNPKIHKANFKTEFQFRPIFASYRTPSYNLSKYLVPILNPLTHNQYTVLNSDKFVDELVSVPSADKFFMVSFDIESLFTNIPIDETISICLDKLFGSTTTYLGFNRKYFKKLLELAVKSSFFIFNDIMYQQCEGLGMGLPLGPTLANIFMGFHEEQWLEDCPQSFKPFFYRRYVDDCFLLFDDEASADKFLKYLNKKHKNIKFTMEKENSNKISFLDVKISRHYNEFITTVYRKPTFTGQTISYFSHCYFNFKINSIKTLILRAYNVCSNYTLLAKELDFLRSLFFINGYPRSLLEDKIGEFLQKVFSPSEKKISVDKKQFYISFNYFGHQSVKMKKELKR